MDRMLDRATPMLKAVGTEEATVVFKSGGEEEDDDDPNDDDDITRSSEMNE